VNYNCRYSRQPCRHRHPVPPCPLRFPKPYPGSGVAWATCAAGYQRAINTLTTLLLPGYYFVTTWLLRRYNLVTTLLLHRYYIAPKGLQCACSTLTSSDAQSATMNASGTSFPKRKTKSEQAWRDAAGEREAVFRIVHRCTIYSMLQA